MDWQLLALPMSALVVGGLAFLYAWLESRAFDRRWGHDRRAPGE